MEEWLAEQLFNAYNNEGPNPWKTFDDRDVPLWHQVSEQVRRKWCAAARFAIAEADKRSGLCVLEVLEPKKP